MDNRTEKAFLGKARHNLKNPVNAILGYSEMLIEDCEDEGIEEPIADLNILYNSGMDILSVIEKNFDESFTLFKQYKSAIMISLRVLDRSDLVRVKLKLFFLFPVK